MGSFARHGSGPVAVVRAYGSQVHPVFMLPPMAAAVFGTVLGGGPTTNVPGVVAYLGAVFAGVYTAHVKDGYVDFHRRDEDDDHPLTPLGCRLGLLASTALFACCLVGVFVAAGPLAVAFAAPGWPIGYLHAPQFDTNPVTATLGYPAGVALAIVGGTATVAGAVGSTSLLLAAVVLVTLAGVKVIDDATDREYDRTIDKRTVAVVLGTERARRLAEWLMGAGCFGLVVGAVTGHLPPSAALAVVPFGVVALFARDASPRVATMLLVRGAYLLFAVLILAVAFRPLSSGSLPDIGVLGPYTYLVTEVAFGTAAVALCVRVDALGRALRTTAVLYPLAYVWDWYTLEVGVFSIPLRTGFELLGIPLEEHLFMLVVPCFVVGVHESLHGEAGGRR